nr:MAG TPA: hypothetical protein [Caudoviricetes sp.]
MAAREEKLDQGYQGYQKWGGIRKREYQNRQGGQIIGSPNPRYVINRKWLQQPDQFLRVSSRQQRFLHQRQGYARLQDCLGFSESSSSDRLTDEQENEIAENIYDWWTSGLGYRQWYAQKFLQLKLDFDAPQS